jgi:hypothetical protein
METNVPHWAQEVGPVVVGILAVFVAAWRYMKTEAGKVTAKATEVVAPVVAASFIDAKLIKELIDTLTEHSEEVGRIAQRITRSNAELREAVIDAAEANRTMTDAITNFVRFLSRQNTIRGDNNVS